MEFIEDIIARMKFKIFVIILKNNWNTETFWNHKIRELNLMLFNLTKNRKNQNEYLVISKLTLKQRLTFMNLLKAQKYVFSHFKFIEYFYIIIHIKLEKSLIIKYENIKNGTKSFKILRKDLVYQRSFLELKIKLSYLKRF